MNPTTQRKVLREMQRIRLSRDFVGRRAEMIRLGQLLDESRAGKGRVVTVCGEAGIGKTRFIAELAAIGEARDCQVLWSQMIEDPVAPPYLAWVLALRSYLQRADDESLHADLGSGASDVADLLPELSDRLGIPASRSSRDSDAARYRLFDAVSRLLLALARRRPLLLLFDNVHLADESSLLLLEYFARQLSGSSSLLVLAYRDDDPGQPFRQVLKRLSGSSGLESFVLGGLARDEVAELLNHVLAEPPPPALVDAVHSRGDGNPLFVRQVANGLARKGADGARVATAEVFELPESLQDVILARLAATVPELRELLRIAAVIGRVFSTALLADLAGRSVRAVNALATKAAASAILETTRPGQFRFQHALFREALIGELSAAERARLHLAAARALESRLDADGEIPATEVAYHWFEASRIEFRPEAVEWCRRAADEAVRRRAYPEASTQLERALQLTNMTGSPDPALRFELYSALGEAESHAGQNVLSDKAWLRAALLAHHHRWPARLADAVLAWQHVRASMGVPHLSSVPLHEAALDMLAEREDAMRARLTASLALAHRHRNQTDRARELMHESIELARRVGDPDVLFWSLIKGYYILHRAFDAPEQLPMMQEALEIAHQVGSEDNVLLATSAMTFPLVKLGRIEAIRPLVEDLAERATAARDHYSLQLVAGCRVKLALLEGRWADALRTAQVSLRHGSIAGIYGVEGRFGFQMFAIQRALGGLDRIAPVLARIETAADGGRTWLPGRVLLHCELGQLREARRALAQLGDLDRLADDDLYETSLVYLAESAAILGDEPRCRQLYERLRPYRGFNLSLLGTLVHGAASGYLALLAGSLRRTDEARELFEEALAFNAGLGSKPILARTRTDYAALLLGSELPDDEARARRLLAEARADAESLDMRSLVQRIDRLSDRPSESARLTGRELDVLRLIATGLSNKQIAEQLHVSTTTVATHIRNILRKTATRNRTEAVDHARRCALIPTD